MGCNTSQELKTKDGSTAANNAANGSEQNEENVVTEQNANNEVEPVHKGGTPNAINEEKLQAHNKSSGRTLSSASAISVTTQPPPSSSQPSFNHGNHTNHSKTNSIVSNGDAITIINRQSLTANTLKSTSLPAKENGSLPQAINGISVNYNINENDDNKFVSDKTEISELNGIEMGEDEAKAAIKIQAAFRGHQVRNTMKRTETKTTTSSSNTNKASTNAVNKSANAALAAAAEAQEPTKAELEAEFDPNDKELCDAARKIQATFRGHLTRKLVKDDEDAIPEDVDIQEITKKVAEELDIDLSDPELNKAATKIQASFRGHKIRKDITPVE